MTKTPKQTAQIIEDTIVEIQKKGVTDVRIALTCKRNNINETIIRRIAMWDKE